MNLTGFLLCRPRSLLWLGIALSLLRAASESAQAQSGDGYGYLINPGGTTITVTNYTGPGGALTIPTSINGLTVTSIGMDVFLANSSVTSVTIPGSIISIGVQAFLECSGLTSVTLSNGVSIIGENAFLDCPNLTNATLPNSVTSIGESAFSECGKLPGVTIGPNVTNIADYAFWNCTSLTNITIPNGVSNIGNYVFSSCASLTSISIPDSITNIGSNTFFECTGLTNVTMGANVATIAVDAFAYCSGLTSLTIPASVISLGDYAFVYCTSLSSVYFQGNAPAADSTVFYGDPATIYYLPGATGWSSPFAGLTPMEEGQSQFGYAINPDGTTVTITNYTGPGGPVTIPTNINGLTVVNIGNSAFYESTRLTSVFIPDGVTNIGSQAFIYCGALTGVSIPSSVTSIGTSAFAGSGLTNVTIGANVTNIDETAFGDCTRLTSISVNAGNSDYSSIAGILFDKSQATLLQYPAGIDGSYVVPNSVTSIGDSAFNVSYLLTSVTIPASVTNIGNDAFLDCSSLTDVYFGSNAPTIGTGVFEYDTTATICYVAGTTGWTDPFAGIPAAACNSGTETDSLQATVSPTNQTVVQGSNASFTVTVSGTGPFTYQWQLNGTNLPNGTNGIIATVAGDGTYGYTGDGGAATNAKLDYPYGVTVDANGNLFIGDTFNARVRKVGTNGIITTVAGDGTYGYAGDGGAATNAELEYPEGVPVDSDGNFFIADVGNNRIRKVGTNGMISTAAGNGTAGYSGDGMAATNTELNTPSDAAVDSTGNLFIAEFSNCRIRKVGANGIITTVAGNGINSYSGDGGSATDAALSYPTGVAMDTNGNLFIADFGNQRIRKVNANGIISTVAGNGTSGYSGDGGPATNAELDLFYSRVAVDAHGNLFISDGSNNRIREVGFNGIISTVAGNGTAGYSGDGGAPTSAALDTPEGVAVDANGNLFIVDYGNNCVREVTFQGPTLVLNDVGAGNAGAYDVIVSSPSGSVTSSVVNLTVTPTINTNQIQFTYTTNADGITITITGYTGPGGVVIIPSEINNLQVTSIGAYAFWGVTHNTSLTSVTIPNTVTSIGADAFLGVTNLASITIPASVTNIGAFAFCSPSLTALSVDGNNPFYSDVNGVLLDKSQSMLIQYPCGLAGAYTIPNSVTSIESNAFYDCTILTSVTIPNSVTSIGANAFGNCWELTSVTIPNSVTNLGDSSYDGVFTWCTNLTSVVIPNSLTDIENDMFFGCTSLKNITIPGNVTNIGAYAFQQCYELSSVTVGDSVTGIGTQAFAFCSNLTAAYFQGNAPSADCTVFDEDENVTVYYLPGTTGWGSTFACVSAVMTNLPAQTGSESPTGSMHEARAYHAAMLLPTGKVLVAGGLSSGDTFLASAELYDPSSGTWTETGAMNTPRDVPTITLLPSGLVLVAGGYTTGGIVTSSAELYDPATGAWSATGSMSTPRDDHTATLLPNGKVLVAGGYDGEWLASAEIYNPTIGTWTMTGSLSTARDGYAATLLSNGMVLAAGGDNNDATLSSAELYNPTKGTWTTAASLNFARQQQTAILLNNGNVLAAAGYNGANLYSAELYNPGGASWTSTGALSTARVYHTGTLLNNGEVIVAGGDDGDTTLSSMEIYNPATGAWTATVSLIDARETHTATLLPSGAVLFAGGYGVNGEVLSSAELYTSGAGPSQTNAPTTDSLEVTITPSSAVAAGAQWQVNGGAFQNSGTTLTGLAQGSYLVSFAPAPGWTPPPDQFATISKGATTVTGVYHATTLPLDGAALVTVGLGTISQPKTLAVGQKYTVKAVARAGYVFAGWVGGTGSSVSLLSTSTSYKFTNETGFLLEANFVTNIFLAAEGSYQGLFAPEDEARQQNNSGSLNFTLSSSGTVSGKLLLGPETVSLNGKFAVDGTARITSKPKSGGLLTTTLQMDLANQAVNGTVSNETFLAQLTGYRDTFSSRHKAPYAGKYTLVMPGATNPAIGPYGTSYGTVTVSASGGVSFAGSLADGTSVSQSSVVSQDGYWPLYINLYSGKGSLWGWNYFTNEAITAPASLSWINGGNSSKTAAYLSGFTNQAAALMGGAYESSQALPSGLSVTLQESNGYIVPSKLTLKTNKTTGVISGAFANPSDPKQTIKVNSVIIQGQTNAQGYFLDGDQSGIFLFKIP